MTVTLDQIESGQHACDRLRSWWEHDAQGIPLCRVCDDCREAKLSRYNPWVLTGYTQADVDEDIEGDSNDYDERG